jgi:hypothetical protein
MNGQTKWVMGIVAAIVVLWLAWTSQTTMNHATAIAVLQTQFVEVRANLIDIKDLVKEIRLDQQRREKKE